MRVVCIQEGQRTVIGSVKEIYLIHLCKKLTQNLPRNFCMRTLVVTSDMRLSREAIPDEDKIPPEQFKSAKIVLTQSNGKKHEIEVSN